MTTLPSSSCKTVNVYSVILRRKAGDYPVEEFQVSGYTVKGCICLMRKVLLNDDLLFSGKDSGQPGLKKGKTGN